jgi:hypothetical protein
MRAHAYVYDDADVYAYVNAYDSPVLFSLPRVPKLRCLF